MRPALSVVLFTVLSGAGLGALALAALADIAFVAAGASLATPAVTTLASVVALLLVIVGLAASTLHLANPRNAWRSLTRWRSSWLSREALTALALIPLATAYAASVAFGVRGTQAPLAVLVVVLSWVMLYCTAMIYASLKPIRQWHTRRVPLAFWLLAHASGALLIVVVATAREDAPRRGWSTLASVLLVLALLAKLEYWRFVARAGGGITLARAIGVEQGVVPPRADARTVAARLLDAGHTKGTFLTREFVHSSPASTRRVLRSIAVIAGFAIPLAWLTAGLADWRGGVAAFATCMIGLVAERWLFFAEARHSVRLYHGEATT